MDPLAEPNEEKHVGSSVMLLSGKDFLKVMKKEKGVFCTIIVKPREESREG